MFSSILNDVNHNDNAQPNKLRLNFCVHVPPMLICLRFHVYELSK